MAPSRGAWRQENDVQTTTWVAMAPPFYLALPRSPKSPASHLCSSTISCPIPARQYGHARRSEEHTSELQSLMRISYAVFCLKKKQPTSYNISQKQHTAYAVKQNRNAHESQRQATKTTTNS